MDFNKELMERIWKHIDKNENGCWLSQLAIDKDGYSRIEINIERRKTYKLHRLLLFWSDQTKVEDFNNPKRLACHSCRNKNCVNPAHLRWDTPKSNVADAIREGTFTQAKMCKTSILTEQQVLEIRERYAKGGVLQKSLAIEYGVHKASLNDIIRRKNWTHI